jgi:ubiquinone/menaquinone biosynthesis C-methylase UbiE
MEQQLVAIRDQQKETWNKFSPGWKKWDRFTMDFLKPMGDQIITMIKPKDGETILDIAAGTGEPGLSIASMIPNGRVVITDLAEGMLKVARENAEQRGIKNIETVACDVCEMPFDDNSFDAISCRMGFMFFPEMLLAAKEMLRVLKPGGRIAASYWWVPEKNPWITIMMGTINRNMELPHPPQGAPGMFRCAKEGMIAGLFTKAGFNNISEKEVVGRLNCKTADTFWGFHTEVAAPVVSAMSKADDAMKVKIKTEVYDLLNQKFPDGNVAPEFSAMVIFGEK